MITAKNYAAQAERDLNKYSAYLNHDRRPRDANLVLNVSKSIGKAVKFMLPMNGIILDDSWRVCDQTELRLPFPDITLEFDTDGLSDESEDMGADDVIVTKWVVFLAEEPGKIAIIVCPSIGGRFKCMSRIGALNTTKHVDIGSDSFYLSEQAFLREPARDEPDVENEIKVLRSMGAIVLGFLGMLSCKNVEQSTHQKVSPKNAQRVKSHKLPIYETKILTLKPTVAQVSGIVSGLGSHASKRQHLRRGHIRRLESGNIWVNSCVVGDASKGVINKQYKMAV